MAHLRLTRDAHGVPGILCDDAVGCYRGLGQVHARLRPLQTLVLTAAARGELMASLWPTQATERLDSTVARLRLRTRAAEAVAGLSDGPRRLLHAYLQGVREGFVARPPPAWLRLALKGLRPPEPQDVAAALLLAGYLSQGEGQARMERALVALVQRGAEPAALHELFGPAAAGLDAAALRRLPLLDLDLGGAPAAGGSNAWALGPERSASGHALLAGDPHQPVGSLPGMFLEVRARIGAQDYLLGATVPGLPAIIVGRNRHLAWSGTFAFADNHDLTLERFAGGEVERAVGPAATVRRYATKLARRRKKARVHVHHEVDDAVLLASGGTDAAAPPGGVALAEHWAARAGLGATLDAFLRLPWAHDVAQAQHILAGTSTLNLQFVLAARKGYVARQRAGATPRRRGDWLGLVPAPGWLGPAWEGVQTPDVAPLLGGPRAGRRRKSGPGADAGAAPPPEALVIAANDGELPWSTLPQPDYRARRIAHLLQARALHDVRSFAAMQADLRSLQAERLRPVLLDKLAHGPLRRALQAWDGRYDAHSVGAHAFDLAWRASLRGLAPRLGGPAFVALLAHSELAAWWCHALDGLLAQPATWRGPAAEGLQAALAAVAPQKPRPWGEVQRLVTRHQAWGRLGGAGTVPLVGSLATVCQGNVIPGPDGLQPIAPAYRLVCDMGEDVAYTGCFGGGDEGLRPLAQWQNLRDWQAVAHRTLRPPSSAEAALD